MSSILRQFLYTLLVIALIAFACLAIFFAGKSCGREQSVQAADEKVQTFIDTLWLHDTISVERPIYRTLRIVDTLFEQVSDTVWVANDSTVALVREQKVYEDSLYRAVISGVHPSLDTIAVFPRHSVITINTVNTVEGQKNRHWGLGVHSGYGVSGDGFTPYIGIGISYNILTW